MTMVYGHQDILLQKFGIWYQQILVMSTNFQIFFLSGFSFTDTGNSQDSRGRKGTVFYSTLTLPPTHKHSGIYLQLCTWDDYYIFLIATLVFTRLQLMIFTTLSNYYFIDWWCDVDFRLIACWFDFRFCYSYLTWETGGIELTSTNILVLQANRLTKCAFRFYFKNKILDTWLLSL